MHYHSEFLSRVANFYRKRAFSSWLGGLLGFRSFVLCPPSACECIHPCKQPIAPSTNEPSQICQTVCLFDVWYRECRNYVKALRLLDQARTTSPGTITGNHWQSQYYCLFLLIDRVDPRAARSVPEFPLQWWPVPWFPPLLLTLHRRTSSQSLSVTLQT